MKKKVIASCVLLVSALFSVLILFHGDATKENGGLAVAAREGKKDTNLNFERSLLASLTGGGNRALPSSEEGNLTKDFARFYAEKLKRTPGALKTVDGKLAPDTIPTNDIANALSNQVSKETVISKTYELKDVRVGGDDSKEAQIAYLRTLMTLWKKNDSTKTSLPDILNKWATEGNTKLLERFAHDASAQINDLLALSVPSSWKTFHLENLNLWQGKLDIANTLFQTDEDPIKTLVALKELEKVSQKNDDLQKTLIKQYIALQA